MVKKVTIALIVILWPLSLFLSNTPSDFLRYIIPTLIVLLSIFLYDKKIRFYLLPILAIPVFEPKLAILPLVYFLFLTISKRSKIHTIYLLLSLLVLLFYWKSFTGQTIFKFDYQAQQQIIQKANLYHSIPLARTFQNKLRIPLNKLSSNFFAVIDPNNYFFGFMPRQILIDNQNLNKFPFLSLIFCVVGLLNIGSIKRRDLIIPLAFAVILNLSVLSAFDRQDFIFYIPLVLIITHGIEISLAKNKKLANILLVLTSIFAIPEIMRIFIQFKK